MKLRRIKTTNDLYELKTAPLLFGVEAPAPQFLIKKSKIKTAQKPMNAKQKRR